MKLRDAIIPGVLFALILALLPAVPVEAQTYALMVYTNTGYSGSMCYSDSPMTANIFSTCNDQISSVTLKPGWSVRLYRDQNQAGPSFCLNQSDTNLTDNTFEDGSSANDAISSFALVSQAWCGGAPTPSYQLEVYNDPGYGGTWCYSWFVQTANIFSNCDDQISSVLLRAGWTVRLYRDANQTGPSRCLTASDANFADNTYEDGSPMDNSVSSFVLLNQVNCGIVTPPNQPPNTPGRGTPPNGEVVNSLSVTLVAQDNGDPDNGPNPIRSFLFAIERIDGAWGASIPGAGTSANVTLPGYGTYRWRAQASDGDASSPWSSWGQFTASIAAPVPAPTPRPIGGAWPVPHYRQGDPAWGALKIGACNNNIANVGCALTSLAMIFKFYGADRNPGTLNSCLGNDACFLNWQSGRIPICSSNKVRFVQRLNSFSWGRLESEIQRGPVILEIRRGSNLHFVVVVKGSGSNPNGYTVNDPGLRNGARVPLSTTLRIFSGYQPSGMRLYTGTPAITAKSNLPTEAPMRLAPPILAAGEVITGTLALFDATETNMILELAATSSAGAVTEMQIATAEQPEGIWQPFVEYVSLPFSDRYSVRFRDAAGNISEVATSGIPVATDAIQAQQFQIYLPSIVR